MWPSRGLSEGYARHQSRTITMDYPSDFVDPSIVPPTLSQIAPFIRVAFDVEAESPHIAYLCLRHALQTTNALDPNSSGRRVMQFKTALRHKLEEMNIQEANYESDMKELQSHIQGLLNYAKSLETNYKNIDGVRLRKTYHAATCLFEVLEAISVRDSCEIPAEILQSGEELGAKQEIYAAYNILPLHPACSQQAVMMLPEVNAALSAIQNVSGLPWPPDVLGNKKKSSGMDIFDWLQTMFGFQEGNVMNQKEHFILLLTNAQMSQCAHQNQDEKLNGVLLSCIEKKILRNYKKWCSYLGCEHNLWIPLRHGEMQQRHILYIGLYLLIWGEAGNLRFMPECLCYVFHHMADDINFLLARNVTSETCKSIRLVYGGQEYSFLTTVIKPMYNVIRKEIERSDGCSHSMWRNYDDLNECFWSSECFRLGWPWRIDEEFFGCSERSNQVFLQRRQRRDWNGKAYVEVRSFWHIYRSFNRMWSFFIVSLQALIVVGWNGSGPIIDMFNTNVFKKVSSIFITTSILELSQALVEIALNIKAWQCMRYSDMLRYILKVVVAIVWVVVLPIGYSHTWESPAGMVGVLRNWLGHSSKNSCMYITSVVIYLIPSAVSALIFFFPKLRRAVERSHWRFIRLFLWWSQPYLFVGRGMHETQYTLFKYTLFWLVLLVNKFLFSYYFEIRPLVMLTKNIIHAPMEEEYNWHDSFLNEKGNWSVVLALWIPVVMVYFMDTQIWYALWSAIFGGINGAFSRIGEIRSLAMLRSRFYSLPGAFDANLVHSTAKGTSSKHFSFGCSFVKVAPGGNSLVFTRFSHLWNEIIHSLRDEDLIDNIQRDLLLVPWSPDPTSKISAWPAFLLASKVPKAVKVAKKARESWNDNDLVKVLKADEYMIDAIEECYKLFFLVLQAIVIGENETRIIKEIVKDVEKHLSEKALMKLLRINFMPSLYANFLKFLDMLDNYDPNQLQNVSRLLQDMLEIYIFDMKRDASLSVHGKNLLDICIECSSESHASLQGKHCELFNQNALCYPPREYDLWKTQVERLKLLVLPEESTIDIPTNSSARRRLMFFTSSLFMDMPQAPKVQNMTSFSILTPYHDEETLCTQQFLEEENDDGVSILDYLQHIQSDEWANFQERLKGTDSKEFTKEMCKWASYRLPTLARTVRGMAYYGKALELQAFLDVASENEAHEAFRVPLLSTPRIDMNPCESLCTDIQALVDIKFTYVISCQDYALYRRTQDYRQTQLLELLKEYPALRMAYIDEVEVAETKEFYSVLVKGFRDNNFHQEVYRIKLPGDPMIGEGKSENQNHAIIFTRGDAVQVVDMNQDNYLEEALKMRNFLQEFRKDSGVGTPSILGMREHNFTESNTSLAGFISSQESSFVTIGQRILVNPLSVRLHYGHSDVFDRLFHIVRGGLSKASRIINSSESIFAGLNTTLRGGNIMHKQYIQVGKGQNVQFSQISHYHAKTAVGNAEQIMSRDIYRLGQYLDFFRMLSVYFTTVGYYVSNLILVLTVYTFLYGRLYLALSGLELELIRYVGLQSSRPLQATLASESFVIFGLFMAAPVVAEIGLEWGFRRAFQKFMIMQLKLASVFFTFSIGTKAHFFGRTLLHGGAHCPQRADRHEFFLCHEKFAQIYRIYSRSHFTKAIELLMLLILYHVYGASQNRTAAYFLINFSLWFLVGAWLFAPFLFNPQGFEWQRAVEDWFDWLKWIKSSGRHGMPGVKSWELWWEEEQSHLDFASIQTQFIEITLSARFFLYQYGVVYHLNIVHQSKSFVVYVFSWLLIVVVLAMLKIVDMSRKWLKQNERCAMTGKVLKQQPRILVRFLKVGVVAAAVFSMTALFVAGGLTFSDVLASALAFIPSGWALLQVCLACRGLVKKASMWNSIKGLARCYDYLMGLVVFSPIAALSWIPAISDCQICTLFNRPFLNFLVSRQQRWKNKAWFLSIKPKVVDKTDKVEDVDDR